MSRPRRASERQGRRADPRRGLTSRVGEVARPIGRSGGGSTKLLRRLLRGLCAAGLRRIFLVGEPLLVMLLRPILSNGAECHSAQSVPCRRMN
jgi:hypothetical protein